MQEEQLPVADDDQVADETETYDGNVEEVDEVFGQPDEMEGDDEGDSGSDKVPEEDS